MVHLKEKCKGTVVALAKVYRAPTKVEAIKYKSLFKHQNSNVTTSRM
jgi:hypothetical protein